MIMVVWVFACGDAVLWIWFRVIDVMWCHGCVESSSGGARGSVMGLCKSSRWSAIEE
jgi:hypothetical protein